MQMQLSSGAQIPDGLLAAMTPLNEKPRLGFRTWENTPYPGFKPTQSTTALGHSWSVASGTRRVSLSCEFGACGAGPSSLTPGQTAQLGGPILIPPSWMFQLLAFWTDATPNAFHASPLRANSGICSIYGNQPYLGTGLQCVCRTAGDSAWSQDTRGCLAADQKAGVTEFIGHGTCYTASTIKTQSFPFTTLYNSYMTCKNW